MSLEKKTLDSIATDLKEAFQASKVDGSINERLGLSVKELDELVADKQSLIVDLLMAFRKKNYCNIDCLTCCNNKACDIIRATTDLLSTPIVNYN